MRRCAPDVSGVWVVGEMLLDLLEAGFEDSDGIQPAALAAADGLTGWPLAGGSRQFSGEVGGFSGGGWRGPPPSESYASPSSSSMARTRLGSTLTPGPMVDDTVMPRT